MSNLGDQIQTAIDEFEGLATGGDWRTTQEGTFLPALQGALNDAVSETTLASHAQSSDSHHTKTTDTRTDVYDSEGVVVADAEAVEFLEAGAATVSVVEPSGGVARVVVSATEQAFTLVASGSTTLTSGSGTADTGIATDSSHYDVNVNPGSADIAASLDGSGSNYVLHFEENTTSVGNPTVGWQLLESQL